MDGVLSAAHLAPAQAVRDSESHPPRPGGVQPGAPKRTTAGNLKYNRRQLEVWGGRKGGGYPSPGWPAQDAVLCRQRRLSVLLPPVDFTRLGLPHHAPFENPTYCHGIEHASSMDSLQLSVGSGYDLDAQEPSTIQSNQLEEYSLGPGYPG